MVNGKHIIISRLVDNVDTPFTAVKSDEINTDCALIEKSSPNQGEWREYVKGRKEWGFSTSWLVGQMEDIKQLLIIGETYTISVYGVSGGTTTKLLTGEAFCTQAKATMQVGNICNGSFAFKGNGALSAVENPSSSSLE